MSSESPTVFVSYSHRDERYKDRLVTHLSVLRGRLAVWDDRKLNAGDDWYAEIEKAMATANVAVLLISADFLASDFISEEEVPRLLRRREQDGLTIVPVLLKSCAWAKIPWLSAMQMRPTDARPLMSLRGNAREEAWSAIVTEILQLAEAPVVQQRFRWIPPGKFTMGSPESELGRLENEGPAHEVTLTEGYWLAEMPCTQALWQAVMGENPSRYKSPERPVETVSWYDCQEFLKRLNQLLPGLEAKLPSEAEWEYACRAGTQAATWNGELETVAGPSGALDAIAWYDGNRGTARGTRELGQKQANPWGLYDMLGNVWEWCQDGQRSYAKHAETDPEGPLGGTLRVIRGGSWIVHARYVRAAFRYGRDPGLRSGRLGFRLSRGPGRGARRSGARSAREEAQRARREGRP